jgi:hypothetical protein
LSVVFCLTYKQTPLAENYPTIVGRFSEYLTQKYKEICILNWGDAVAHQTAVTGQVSANRPLSSR